MNQAPLLAAIADQSFPIQQQRLAVTLVGSDADGDPLTYSGRVVLSPEAYQLDQQLGLSSSGNYYTNFQGHNEKWLQGNDAQYFLLPNGELRRWRDSTYSYGPAGLVATLDSSFYVSPARLWDAKPAAAITVQGNQLTLEPPADFVGSFRVEAAVSDGLATATRTFRVTVTNRTPVLSAIGDRSMPFNQDTLTVTLAATDPDLDPITFAGRVIDPDVPAQAYALDQQLRLAYMGNYYTGFQGYDEKWLQGADAQYLLLPNGELRRWRDYVYTYGAQGLVATLSANYYADPSLLWNATPVPASVSVWPRALELKQRLGLSYMGSYFTNFQGHNEKWLQGATAQYFILPGGELRHWRDAVYSYGPAGLVAVLNPSFYDDPSKLWAAAALPAISVSGNQLLIDPAAGFSGTFIVEASASDNWDTDRKAFLVTVAAPAGVVANAGPDRTANEGASVQFTGSATGGSGAYTFSWNFGDGGSGTGASPSHVFNDNGTYTVTLTVTDSQGRVGQDSAVVTVNNVAPTSLPGGPYSGAPAVPVSFSGSATDPSSVDTAAGFTYAWNFGDGATSILRNPTHAYAAIGTYTVTLTVRDKDAGAHSATTTAAITSSAGVVANAGPDQTANEGTAVQFTGSATGGSGTYTYSWNFGDGGSGTGASPSHAFNDNGTYTVTLTVTDSQGRVGQDSAVITVSNVAPTSLPGGPYTSAPGLAISFSGSASDPSSVDTAAGFTYAWNFGDGASSTLRNPTHAYAANGTYTVTLTVRDKDAGASSATTTAVITSGRFTNPFIITAGDKIPNFGANPNIYTVASGNWSNVSIWSAGRLPTTGDIVSIDSGVTVTYDVVSANPVDTVIIQLNGHLVFRTDITTKLTVRNLLVLQGGELQIGTPASPVAAGVKAEVVFINQVLDTVRDPAQYGNGLVALGRVTMHGAVQAQTFVRLTAEARTGASTLTLAQPATGWRVGDVLVLPDTRQLAPGETGQDYLWQGENVTIAAISADGRTLTLAAPLARNHLGARRPDGTLEFLPHVGNRTRNVVVRSESAAGTRGHAFFTDRAEVDIRYVGFAGLGRTKNTALDNTRFDAAGRVTHVGTNQAGRYSLHFRQLVGPVATPANGYQFTFIGNAVFCPMGDHSFKWGVTLQDSHYGLIQDNVLYNWAGSGIVALDGNESFNVIERNFVVRTRGDHGWDRPFDVSGSHIGGGLWMAGFNNYVRDNVVANVPDHAGYMYFAKVVGEVLVPASRGARPSVTVNMNATPIREFARNETYGAVNTGLSIWWLGDNGTVLPVGPSVVKDYRVWHQHMEGIYEYEMNNVIIDGMVGRGDLGAYGRGSWNVGISGTDYKVTNSTVRNADIQGMGAGIVVATTTGGTQKIENSYLNNTINIALNTLTITGGGMAGPRRTEIRNVRFGTIAGIEQTNIGMFYSDQYSAPLVEKDEVFVYDYNGVAGANYQVYYNEQRPDFIVPKTTAPTDPIWLIGSPEAGLTNQQNWAKYGIAIAGAVAPANATTRAGIKGLVRPL